MSCKIDKAESCSSEEVLYVGVEGVKEGQERGKGAVGLFDACEWGRRMRGRERRRLMPALLSAM